MAQTTFPSVPARTGPLLPVSAAWRHVEARDGFEVLFLHPAQHSLVVRGATNAVEQGQPWSVSYEIEIGPDWRTRAARVSCLADAGATSVELGCVGGQWQVAGVPAPHLRGCLDVDLEASAFTNALPVHRLALAVGQQAAAPAAYVSAAGEVTALEQHYRRLPDADGRARYDYSAPAFDFRAVISYDAAGLVVDYPGLAVRVA